MNTNTFIYHKGSNDAENIEGQTEYFHKSGDITLLS